MHSWFTDIMFNCNLNYLQITPGFGIQMKSCFHKNSLKDSVWNMSTSLSQKNDLKLSDTLQLTYFSYTFLFVCIGMSSQSEL